MFELIITLAVLTFFLWLGYKITGTLLSAAIWLFIKLPFAIILFCLGLALCATLLLIPLGIMCFKFAFSILF